MSHLRLLGCSSLVLALTASCATVSLPEHARAAVESSLLNKPRQLAVSVWVAPFFHDASRRLVTVAPPDETDLVVTPRGEPIRPGAALEVLPAGTKVRVLRFDHPDALSLLQRPLVSPRECTWVELLVEGRGADVSYVFVAPPDVDTEDELNAALAPLLTTNDVRAEVAALPALDRHAVLGKLALPGTGTRALELALGSPYYRKRFGDGSALVETWTFRSDARDREVRVKNGVVVEVVEPKSFTAAR